MYFVYNVYIGTRILTRHEADEYKRIFEMAKEELSEMREKCISLKKRNEEGPGNLLLIFFSFFSNLNIEE